MVVLCRTPSENVGSRKNVPGTAGRGCPSIFAERPLTASSRDQFEAGAEEVVRDGDHRRRRWMTRGVDARAKQRRRTVSPSSLFLFSTHHQVLFGMFCISRVHVVGQPLIQSPM